MIEFIKMNRRWTHWLSYIIIILASILSYYPTFTGEFILDDKPLIKQNPYISQVHSIESYLIQEDGVSKVDNPENYHTGYYRPLINLSYWVDNKVWGMKAAGFRTTNLSLHIFCCFVLFWFIVLLTKDRKMAFWPVLMFAVHPVNTEAVSWITSRNNVLATIFTLSALCVFIKAHEQRKTPMLILSAVLFTGALFSKEFGVMLLPILFLYRRIILRAKSSVMEETSWYLPFILILILYFILRQKATSSWLSPEGFEDIWTRVYFVPYLVVLNLKMIFLPFNLHSFIVKYPDTYLNWKAISSIIFIVICGFGVWKKRDIRIVAFSFVSFLVALFPVMNIIPTSGVSVVSMRWLYFPMVFLIPALAEAVKRLLKVSKFVTVAALSLAVVYCGLYSLSMNKGLWHDEESFFKQEIHRFDNSYYAYGYALNHLENKDNRKAERYFKIAINGYHSNRAKALIDYAALLNDTGRHKDAIDHLKRAYILPMLLKEKGEWLNNMGTAHFHLKNPDRALSYFKLAVANGPNESLFWANLGAAFGVVGKNADSVRALKKGLEINPDSIKLRKNLAVTYVRMKEYEKAIEVLNKIALSDIEKNTSIKSLLKNIQEELSERNSRSY